MNADTRLAGALPPVSASAQQPAPARDPLSPLAPEVDPTPTPTRGAARGTEGDAERGADGDAARIDVSRHDAAAVDRARRLTRVATSAATLAAAVTLVALILLEGGGTARPDGNGPPGAPLDALRAVTVLAAGIAVSVVDIRERRIPNLITLPTATALLASAAIEGVWRLAVDPQLGIADAFGPLGALAAGALAAGGPFLLLAWFGTMGGGDVKLASLLGAALLPLAGWQALGAAVLCAYVLAVPQAVAIVWRRRRHRQRRGDDDLPFGPYLVGGAALALPIAASGGMPLPLT